MKIEITPYLLRSTSLPTKSLLRSTTFVDRGREKSRATPTNSAPSSHTVTRICTVPNKNITELIPGKKTAWRVLESDLSFLKDKNEWTGTEIVFDVSAKRSKTEVRFAHAGLEPQIGMLWQLLERVGHASKRQFAQADHHGKKSAGGVRVGGFMKNQDFTATISVDQTPEEALNAIRNVRRWWSENIEGNTDKLGDEFTYRYQDVQYCEMKLVEVIPGKKLLWLVLDNFFNFTEDKSEWKGTKVIFEVSKTGDKTEIHFPHQGLVPR